MPFTFNSQAFLQLSSNRFCVNDGSMIEVRGNKNYQFGLREKSMAQTELTI